MIRYGAREISKRKGNIKRCCWHRSVQSFGFYFTVRLASAAAEPKPEPASTTKRMYHSFFLHFRTKRTRNGWRKKVCVVESFNRFWRIKFVNMNFKPDAAITIEQQKLRLFAVIWEAERVERADKKKANDFNWKDIKTRHERITLAHPIKPFYKSTTSSVSRSGDKLHEDRVPPLTRSHIKCSVKNS